MRGSSTELCGDRTSAWTSRSLDSKAALNENAAARGSVADGSFADASPVAVA